MRQSVLVYAAGMMLLIFAGAYAAHAGEELTVKSVVDGETLELSDGRLVRMIGVVTQNVRPLLASRFQSQVDEKEAISFERTAAEAKSFNQKNVVGRKVILSLDKIHEGSKHLAPDGKLLAYVWYTVFYKDEQEDDIKKVLGIISVDKLLNAELVKLGYGFVDTQTAFSHQEMFLRLEQQAAESRRGVWKTEAEFYKDSAKKAQGSLDSSVDQNISQEARELSMKSAWRTLTELIEKNPKDYRAYYQRSWLGASPFHDLIQDQNLQDIELAHQLFPYDPSVMMQKHFLLRLLGRHDKACEAYAEGAMLIRKFGGQTQVSDLTEEELASGKLAVTGQSPVLKCFEQDMFRATLNEDHYFILMARIKQMGEQIPDEVRQTMEVWSDRGLFEEFKAKHKKLVAGSTAHGLLYQTQWALRGLDDPQAAIQNMEKVGQISLSAEDKK